MFLCGFNSFGQLERLVSNEENAKRVSVRQFERAVHEISANAKIIAFAWNHAVIVEKDGSLWRSGFVCNESAKLFPVKNLPFSGVDIKQVDCSRERLYCVTLDGQLWEQNYATNEWRDLKRLLPLSDLVGLEVKVCKVSVGFTFVATLTEDGKAFVLPHEHLVVPPELGHVEDLDCGHEHGILLTSEGHVLTWGTALRGQLGNDSVDTCPQPAEVQALAGLKFVAIAAGGWHSCAVSREGDIYVWGWNKFGQLGHPRPQDDSQSSVSVAYIPVVVDWPLNDAAIVVDVRCGTSHTIAKLSNGELWGCGWNKYGQLGLGKPEIVTSMTKLPMPGEFKAIQVVCGSWNSALITKETDVCQTTLPCDKAT